MMSNIFQNAHQPQINGGQFSITNYHLRTGPRGTGIDLLREYCAIGAILDSSERFDPPRCAAETREAIIKMILDWINAGGESASMAWLFGGAGAGKSALAQTIAEILQREGRLAASFFFSRTATVERSDGYRLIPTLVFQLLGAFSGLKPHVEECINENVGLFDRSPRTQMDLLFIKSLTELKQRASSPITFTSPEPSTPITTPPSLSSRSKSHRQNFFTKVFQRSTKERATAVWHEIPPQLIIIDGLDECSGQELQVELLRILAGAIPRFPFPLRILIVSRPEGSITRTFDHDESFQSLDVLRISLGDDDNADNDIRKFLIKGFQEIHRTHPLRAFLSPSWPPDKAITTLVQKSSSHFIYASTAMKYIQYSRGRPDSRLEIILGLLIPPMTDKPFAQIDALYTHIFMSMDEPDRITANHLFGIMYISSTSQYSYMENVARPLELEEYFSMQPGEIHLLMEPLFSLVLLSAREDNIKILHASLFDFLLDVSRSGDLHLDLETAHVLIAKRQLKLMLRYTLDVLLSELTTYDEDIALNNCWAFLYECHIAHLSDDARDYLPAFPYLYDVILHPKYLIKRLTSTNARPYNHIPFLLHMFFTLLLEKGFNDGQHLHAMHATQIKQRLESIHVRIGCERYLHDDVEPLFNSTIYQYRHSAHKAFINVYLAIHGKKPLSDIFMHGENSSFPDDPLANIRAHVLNVRAHALIILLPHLTYNEVISCTEYTNLPEYSPRGDNELHQVLLQRVVEYLQRVGPDTDPSDLWKCKVAWGITD